MLNDIPELEIADMTTADLPEKIVLEGMDMPKLVSIYQLSKQKDGKPLGADDSCKETWLWLKECKCKS